ncbi:hypothetical protein M413DRAFT_442543 [Hebeloma cylindrosporum]|uniref:Uncharacterized protein n=1 Tax=Hebeloma cylindrosporum TaxID=76867 RepID=A0A0C3CKE6_HEBCY|nr:hypothetical protein M413DRAFT_442543 [Hebeloma cylindrosporum h7]
MEVLKKFEEQSVDPLSLTDADDDDEGNPSDLANRLEAVDLDSVSSDVLWSMLTPEERSKFTKLFNDPTSELAQQLLSSERLETEIQEPWWEALVAGKAEDDAPLGSRGQFVPRRSGTRPNMMKIPASMVKPGSHLVIRFISYAYIIRHLGISALQSLTSDDPEHHEARRLVTKLVPFLTDRKSMELYPSLSTVITDIWSTFDLGDMTSDLFSLLLRDAAYLLEPMRITQVEPAPEAQEIVPASHPHVGSILVLSDLSELFLAGSTRAKGNHITRKLLFYAAHIASTPSITLRGLVKEMSTRAEIYRAQANDKTSASKVQRVGDGQQQKLMEEM